MMKNLERLMVSFNSQKGNENDVVETGVIKGIDIISLQKTKDWRWITEKFKRDIVKQGNKNKKGVPSRLGHPEIFDSKPTHYIGRYKNFTYKDGKKGVGSVTADLYLDDITKKTKIEGQGISTYDYIVEMAANNPDVFGNSILYYPSKRHWVTEKGKKLKDLDDDESFTEIWAQDELGEFEGSDLVDVPAGTKGLFKENKFGTQMSLQMLSKRGDLLKENPELAKYINQLNNGKQEMKKKEKPTKKVGKTKEESLKSKDTDSLLKKLVKVFKTEQAMNVNLTTAEGMEIEVVTEAEDIMVGDEVLTDGSPVEEGTHLLADGREIETDGDGIIQAIRLADDSETESEGSEDEGMSNEDSEGLNLKIDSLIDVLSKMGEKIVELDNNLKSQKVQITKLNKNFTSKKTTSFANKASDEDTGDVWDRAFAELKVLRSKENETRTKNIV